MSTPPWEELGIDGELRDPEIDDIGTDDRKVRDLQRHRAESQRRDKAEQRDREYRERRLNRIRDSITTAFDNNGIHDEAMRLKRALCEVISDLFPEEPFNH